MATASNFLQDLQSHAVALRQRGCERIVDFLHTATVQDAKPVLTDELLRKISSLVTDLSPIVSTLAMEFIALLFQKLPPGKKVIDDENQIWLPSLAIVNQMSDALLCRLADAKAPIRAKAKATLTSVAMRTDVSIMLHKLHNLSTSRNVYMKRNILELMTEILSSDSISWSKEELFSCAKNVILTANVFLPQDHMHATGELVDMAFQVLELLLHVSLTCISEETIDTHSGESISHSCNNNVVNMLALFGDLHVRTETLGKLHLLASQLSNHPNLEKTNAVLSPEKSMRTTRQEEKVANHIKPVIKVRYEKASIDNFDIPAVCRFFLSEEENSKAVNTGLNFIPYGIQGQTDLGFVYLPKNAISLISPQESLQLLEKITRELSDEENWQKRYQSLQLLQSFVWGSGSINNTSFSPCLLYEQVTFAALMRQLQDVIVLQLQDLRSMIVKEICRCLCVMVYQFYQYKTYHLSHTNNAHVLLQKQNILPLIDMIWPQVLKLLVSKTQIMSSSADMLVRVCLLASFDETNSQVTFNKWCTLIQDMLRSKNTLLHRYAMEYLLWAFLRFTHNNSTSPLSTNSETLFLSCLKMGLSDAHSDARKFARVLYRVLQRRDTHALGEGLWVRCDTDLDVQVLKQLKHSVKDEAGDLVLSESCYGLTWAMLAYIRHARFSLYDVLNVHSSEEENDIEGAVVAAGNERNLFAGAENDQMYMGDDFDWMAAAISEAQPLMKMEVSNTALNTTTAPKVRMSMLSSAPSRPLLANAMPSAVSNNINVTNSTNVNANASAKSSLLMGGARRLSVAALPIPPVSLSNNTAISTNTTSLLGGGARRMSFMPPPTGSSSMMPTTTTLPMDLPMVTEEDAEHLFDDDSLANLEDTAINVNTTSNMSSFSRRMSMVTSAKRVLQPAVAVSSSANVNDNTSNTNANSITKPIPSSSAVNNKTMAAIVDENMHPSGVLGDKTILKKKAPVPVVQQASELDLLKQLLTNSATSAVNKVKLLESFAQHMTSFFTRHNTANATAEAVSSETKEIVHLCFPVMWDMISDTNVKLYTEAMKALDVCFGERLFSETFLLPNHHNNTNNNVLLSMMCLKMFTALIDAKPVAKECINKISTLFLKHIQVVNNNDNNMVIHTVLKVLFSRVKDLPERALAATFQFAGALIPSSLPTEANTASMVPFVQEVMLRCMHVLVPSSVNLDVDLQFIATDSSSSLSSIPHTTNTRGKTSNNAINSVKPSPVAMLAGKRLLVKLYEYVEASNKITAKTADSLFFKAVAGFSLAQQNVLKTLLVSLMPASQFDLKLTQQMKREKQMLLMGSKKNAINNGNIVAQNANEAKESVEDHLVKTGNVDSLLTIVTQLTQQQPVTTVSVSPHVSPLKIETNSPVNSNNNSSKQQEEKLALLDAVVQQVCRSPSVTASVTTPSLSISPVSMKQSNISTPNGSNVNTAVVSPVAVSPVVSTNYSIISTNSSVKMSPVVPSPAMSASPFVSSPSISDILSSPSASTSTSTTPSSTSFSASKDTISSPVNAILISSAGKQQPIVSTSPEEKASNVLSLLSSVRKVSSPNMPLTLDNDKNIATALFTKEMTESVPEESEMVCEKEEIKDYQFVKTQLLKLDVGLSTEANAEMVENLLANIEMLSLTSVQAMETILLLLDIPLYISATDNDNSTTSELMEKVHLVMSTLWDTCVTIPTSDNLTSVLEKVFVFFVDYNNVKDANTARNTLSEVETMTVNFTLHILKRFLHFLKTNANDDDNNNDHLLLNVCQWLLAFTLSNNNVPVAHLVLKLQLFACVLQQYPISGCFGEQWDGLWQSVVVWASSSQILGHSTATLVRQQATLCLARVFCAYFYRGNGTIKERKEKCLQWFLPLTVMQRKLLMVYVEKFRVAQCA